MRIIFLGQAAFGRDALEILIQQNENVVGVLTIPDSPGRANPLKALAAENNLPVLQQKRLKEPEAYEWVKALRPDLLVLAFVTDFVPKRMISLSTNGGINYHPSLLPKYRGGSAMNWAIINGEKETGVTIHQIDEGVDTGPIILQEKVYISPDDTLKDLYFKKLYPLGIRMVAEAVRLIREGEVVPKPQEHSQASFQPVIRESDVIIDWSQPTKTIYDLIRGSNPSPGATTDFKGEKLKIWEGKPHSSIGNPGEIVEVNGEQELIVATGDGSLSVHRLQFWKMDKITASQFILKTALKVGDRFGVG